MFNFSGKKIEELQKVILDKQSSLDALEKKIADLKRGEGSLQKKLKDSEKEISTLSQAQDQARTDSKNAQQQIEELKKVQDKFSVQNIKISELEEKNKKLVKESKANDERIVEIEEARKLLEGHLKTAQEELSQEKTLKVKAVKENNENFNNFKKLKTLNQHAKKKIDDQVQERELLLIQISQLTEEQNTNALHLKTLNALNKTLESKLKRLMSKIPNYVDFGGIEFVSQDSVSEVPQILWKMTDYSNGSVVLPEFYFKTSLDDGLAGIGIVQSPQESIPGPVLVPQLIGKSLEQLDLFKSLSGDDWQQIKAAAAVLEHLLQTRGQSLQNGADFDFAFWQNSLTNLVANIKRLPALLRYKQAKLKRESQNPDYEHLWIELYDVEFGDFSCPKFELRLGASMIQAGGFSKHPKLEFPLINGKLKPFESWFPESSDDFGPKFELRFSLEGQVFDIGAFLKLSEADQRLMQALILVIPSILTQLVRSKVSIHRKWDTWLAFAGEIAKVFQLQVRAANPALQASPKAPESVSTPVETFAPISAQISAPAPRPATVPTTKQVSPVSAAPAFSQVPTRSVKSKSVTVMVAKKAPKKEATKAPTKLPNKTKKVAA
jgi:hypothetical protein